MKIVHFESGLGNQMLNYAEYLAIKENYADVCSEKLIYETLPNGKGISQWNGYELEKDFGIIVPDLKDFIGSKKYEDLKKDLIKSKYWENNWKYAVPIVDSLNKNGVKMKNFCLRGTDGDKEKYSFTKRIIKCVFFKTRLGNLCYRILAKLFCEKLINNNYTNLYIQDDDDFYCGQTLKFMYKNMNIERIEKQLRKDFEFKNIHEKNIKYAAMLKAKNSVSIHARRGDFLSRNSFCYKYGYFKRSIKFIKKNVENPVFVFFCDTDSIEWVKNNLKTFGLKKEDTIEFVDWNIKENSYQDLYLMSNCRHNIITQSSFGWWGAWLNDYPNKITISPDCRINTKYWK